MEKPYAMTTNCIDSLYLFNSLTKEQRSLIFKLVRHRSYLAGERIYSPGETANSVYIISSGKARIYRLSENGREQLIRLLVPGEFTGELALFKEGIYEAYAESIEDTRICMIHHSDFKLLLESYPEISVKMLATLANRLSSSEEQSMMIGTETAKERIMHYLTKSAVVNTNNEIVVNLKITKRDLASYLGVTPETLSRQWRVLEEEGVIVQKSRSLVKLIGVNIDFGSCMI